MPTFALNFYSPIVADQLRTGRKTATIRLGDKSAKYKKGMIVTVLVGARYGQREKVFDAVIDKVDVKQLSELSPREIEHDNPEIRRLDEFSEWLGRLYNRPVSDEDTVTVIRFSQIVGTMFSRVGGTHGSPAGPPLPASPGRRNWPPGRRERTPAATRLRRGTRCLRRATLALREELGRPRVLARMDARPSSAGRAAITSGTTSAAAPP